MDSQSQTTHTAFPIGRQSGPFDQNGLIGSSPVAEPPHTDVQPKTPDRVMLSDFRPNSYI